MKHKHQLGQKVFGGNTESLLRCHSLYVESVYSKIFQLTESLKSASYLFKTTFCLQNYQTIYIV